MFQQILKLCESIPLTWRRPIVHEREQKRAPAIGMMGQNKREEKPRRSRPSLNSGVEGGTADGEANQALEGESICDEGTLVLAGCRIPSFPLKAFRHSPFAPFTIRSISVPASNLVA